MSCRRNKHHEGDPTGLHGRNKYCSCSPGLRCAAKIALFRSTGQLQRRNVALSRWRKGAQLCHAAETNTMKATQQGCTEGTSTAVVPLAAVRPKYSTGQLSKRSTGGGGKGAQLCHAAETNTMKATQQGCTEGTSTAVVPLGRSMWKAQLPPRGNKFEYLHLFRFTSSTRRRTAFPDGERVAKHIRSISSLTLCRYCLLRHLASRHHSPFQLQPPAYSVPHPVRRASKKLLVRR